MIPKGDEGLNAVVDWVLLADRVDRAEKNQRICSIRDTELTSVPGIC
jgi:hypothetical protein